LPPPPVKAHVRHAAIARVTNPTVLGTCAVHDTLAANRAAAAARLEDRPTLELVARQIGKRDKNVHRLVRQKLKALQGAATSCHGALAPCARSFARSLSAWAALRVGRKTSRCSPTWTANGPRWSRTPTPPRGNATPACALDSLTPPGLSRGQCAEIAAEEARAALRVERRALLVELAEAVTRMERRR